MILITALPSDLDGSEDGSALILVHEPRETVKNMGNRLYVGNLSFNADTQTVREAFTSIGEVTDVHLVTDRDTGRSRGFAFVTMGSSQLAAEAMSQLNGTLIDGRALRVNEAEERSGGGRSGGATRRDR